MNVLRRWFFRTPLLAAVLGLYVAVAWAQEAKVSNAVAAPKEGAPMVAPPGASQRPGAPVSPGERPGKPGEQPGKPGKPSEGPKTIQRPVKPTKPPNPDELKVRPDKTGKVRVNFNGQPWPGVLDWLAESSGKSLDWQELPGDYLNLATQRPYTIEEVQDLINRHLLARGYTILCEGDSLTVVDVKKVNPSLVPRVRLEELDKRLPNEFVRVSFPLDWLLAETAAEELKPMLGPSGSLKPMTETNRLEAMDAVGNLREIARILKQEQSPQSEDRLVKEFPLQYARASEVRDQLQTLLGIEGKPAAPAPPQNPDQARQQAMMAQAQQAGGQAKPGEKPPGAAKPPAVTLVADSRKNTLLVRATPDKMAIVDQAIRMIDVPVDDGPSLAEGMAGMHVYRLAGVDPDLVVKTLQQIGSLSPTTRLDVDRRNKAIIAYASAADHVMIDAIVKRLSGSERQLRVIRLRRLPADYVAGTVAHMMNVKPKKQERPRPYWMDYSRETPAEEADQFQVDADVTFNRLLLRANEIEYAQVMNLLAELGETTRQGGSGETIRVIDSASPEETEELLERIRRAWPAVAPNPLELPPKESKEKEPQPTPHKPTPKKESASETSRTTMRQREKTVFHLVQFRREVEAEAGADGPSADKPALVSEDVAKSPPPVKIAIGPEGQLILSSQDTRALDRLEELAAQLAPPRKHYKIFKLAYAWAPDVAKNLEEFFQDDKKQPKYLPFWYFFEMDMGDEDSQGKDERRLSKRPRIRFIPDIDTSSILVEWADPDQLKTIEELIHLYDQPPGDAKSVRKSEVIPIRYSKASTVADTVKEVYRDLLSANDKALMGGGSQQRERRSYDWGPGGAGRTTEEKIPKFKGLLSIGVDEVSNSLVVSAPTYLFEQVAKMIQELDVAAAPNNAVRVVKVGPGMSSAHLQEVLKDVLGAGAKSTTTPSTHATPGAGARKTNRAESGTRSSGED